MPLRIAMAGGGTGGHLYPALAIADCVAAERPGVEFLFFGTSGKIESRVVPGRGLPFRSIWISGFHRDLRPENLLFPLKLAVSLLQSWVALRSFRPDVVVGTGGYVCGPVLRAAAALGIPTVVHESNSYPGVTTRLLAGRVTKVLLAFEETRRWLSPSAVAEVVGTPVRPGLGTSTREEGCTRFGLDRSKPVVLVLGGSQGAASLNRAIAKHAEAIKARGIQLIWQTGEAEAADIVGRFGSAGLGLVTGFLDDMDAAYAAADLVVGRAGASTLAELTLLGKPSVLVPLPHAAADHQTKNARALEAAGAAVVVTDDEAGTQLPDRMFGLIDDRVTRARMAAAAKALGRPDAGRSIARIILGMVTP